MSESWRPRQPQIARLARAQQSMIPGTVGGRVANAQPVRTAHRQEDGALEIVEAVFSYPGTPGANEESPPYTNRLADADVGTIIASTRSTTTTQTVVAVLLNGAEIGRVTVPAGAAKTGETVIEDVAIDYGDHLTVKAVSVGSGLSGLVVQVLIEG